MMAQSEYLLGTGDEELARLVLQHRVWAAHTDALLDAAEFGRGDHLLDLGCGPGLTTTEALAERAGPNGRVVGVESSARYAQLAREHFAHRPDVAPVEVRVRDVADLSFPRHAFDGALARWLFLFLNDPAAVLRNIHTCLRPGGRLAVLDYFKYVSIDLFPHSDVFDRMFRHVYESFRAAGGDLDIAGKLPALFAATGFQLVDLQPVVEIGRPGSGLWQWVRAFQDSYLPRLVADGRVSEAELAEFRADWAAHESDPQALFFAPPMLGLVAERL